MSDIGYICFFGIMLLLFNSGTKSEIRKLRSEIRELSQSGKKIQNRVDSEQLKEIVGKQVHLNIDNEDIDNEHIFSQYTNTKGIIKEMDDEWLLFEFEDGGKKFQQYFRIRDITSIEE